MAVGLEVREVPALDLRRLHRRTQLRSCSPRGPTRSWTDRAPVDDRPAHGFDPLVESALVQLIEADALLKRGVDLVFALRHAIADVSYEVSHRREQPGSRVTGLAGEAGRRVGLGRLRHLPDDDHPYRDADAQPEESPHRWRALRSVLRRARSSASSSSARRFAEARRSPKPKAATLVSGFAAA